ncbi:unnamed protein product [Rotaria sp. Silwood2]|nr:unnamed protein product [Rotaria sp. Silwood2]
MYAPVFSPINPNLTQQQRSYKNVLNGYAESTTLSDFQFENQRRTFDSFGYAADSSVGEHDISQIVGDQTSAEINQGMTVFETSKKRSGEKRKKEKNNDPSDVEGFHGPWAPFVDEITVSRPPEEEQKEIDEYLAKKRKAKQPTFEDRNAPVSARDPESTTLNKESEDSSSTTLHIKDPYDNQGRSFLHIPQDVDVNLRHTKAIQKVHYFPISAHLFLTCSMDCKVKFDIRSGHVVQEYDRHLGAINTVTFVDRNRRIVSTSDDKSIRVSGYACGLDFSSDMSSYVISGDADGRLAIWNWKTTRIFERIKAHDDVCIDAKWHWHEKSRVLTAGWDNVVKLWD